MEEKTPVQGQNTLSYSPDLPQDAKNIWSGPNFKFYLSPNSGKGELIVEYTPTHHTIYLPTSDLAKFASMPRDSASICPMNHLGVIVSNSHFRVCYGPARCKVRITRKELDKLVEKLSSPKFIESFRLSASKDKVQNSSQEHTLPQTYALQKNRLAPPVVA